MAVVAGMASAEAEVMPQSAAGASVVAASVAATAVAAFGVATVVVTGAAMAMVATDAAMATVEAGATVVGAGAVGVWDFGPAITATTIPTITAIHMLMTTRTVGMDTTGMDMTATGMVGIHTHTRRTDMDMAIQESATADTTAA